MFKKIKFLKKNLSDYILGSTWIVTLLDTKELSQNSSFNYELSCGMNNCPNTRLGDSSSKPSQASIYRLLGMLSAATLLAFVICILFVDDLNYDHDLNPVERHIVSIEHMGNWRLFTDQDCYLD